jgi:hypothetical protein
LKKVLVTGFSRAACTRDFHKNSQIGLSTSHYSFVKCLEDMGYEVDQRRVEIGEDLSGYHRIFVFLMHISPFDTNIYNSLWTIANYDDKTVLCLEDWQSPSNISKWGVDIDHTVKSITNQYYVDNVVYEECFCEEWRKDFTKAFEIVSKMDKQLFLPTFLGGNIKILFPEWQEDKLNSWYPPPYHLHRKPGNWDGEGAGSITDFFAEEPKKEEVWNFAGLIQSETEKWFNRVTKDATWPIQQYGSKSKKQTRLTETEMVQTFQSHWGILMPGYYHAGSGWWRVRPQQVADVGSIIVGDQKEADVLYGKEVQMLTCAEVEAMSETTRKDVAAFQTEKFYEHQPLDKNITQEQLKKVL